MNLIIGIDQNFINNKWNEEIIAFAKLTDTSSNANVLMTKTPEQKFTLLINERNWPRGE